MSSTDGVGSKLKVAFLADRHDTVGIDLVAMGVNDLLVHGAEPFYFLDYLAMHRVEPARGGGHRGRDRGGLRQAGCALVGGETAEMPDFYAPGEYDLAGFAVGVVERSRIVTARRSSRAIACSGWPPRGCTQRLLARAPGGLRAARPRGRRRLSRRRAQLADELLSPTRIYVKSVLALLRARDGAGAMAHMTGGGIAGNLPRVLPEGCRAVMRRAGVAACRRCSGLIQEAGRVDEARCGAPSTWASGYLVVVRAEDADGGAGRSCAGAGESVFEVGEIEAGRARSRAMPERRAAAAWACWRRGAGRTCRPSWRPPRRGAFPAEVVLVVSERRRRGALEIARAHGIPAEVVEPRDHPAPRGA